MRTETGNGQHVDKQLVALHCMAVRFQIRFSQRALLTARESSGFTEENGFSPIPTGASSYLFDSAPERLVVPCGAVSLPQVLCP